jgi:hypothetical protein
MKRVLAVPPLIALSLLLTACDSFVGYTVTNDTNEDLLAWVFFNDCENVTGYSDEYDYERAVSAGTTTEVSEVEGAVPRGDWCLQVVDADRRLVLAEPYDDEHEVLVVIQEPLSRGPTIPQTSDLPDRPFLGTVWRTFAMQPLSFIFAVVVVVGMVYGTFLGIRATRASRRPPLN